MDTTAAATQAGVTVATIRHWCRRGAVRAVKTAGRWAIDTASLNRRIEIGREHMTQPTTRYTVQPVEKEQYGRVSTYYDVVRTDGTKPGYLGDNRIGSHCYLQRERAEVAAEFLNSTPDCYRLDHRQVRGGFGSPGGWDWKVTGGRQGDPRDVSARLHEDWEPIPGTPNEGKRVVDMLIGWTLDHDKGAEERIREHAEKQAVAEAERQVREAREAQLAELRRAKGELATPRQVDYILDLLERRRISGEGGGFYYGPTDRAGIEEMSKNEASVYIRSLKGDY